MLVYLHTNLSNGSNGSIAKTFKDRMKGPHKWWRHKWGWWWQDWNLGWSWWLWWESMQREWWLWWECMQRDNNCCNRINSWIDGWRVNGLKLQTNFDFVVIEFSLFEFPGPPFSGLVVVVSNDGVSCTLTVAAIVVLTGGFHFLSFQSFHFMGLLLPCSLTFASPEI
jgi:hypothetical protein